MFLEIAALRKSYGDVPALRGVDLAVAAGEVVALLGPSGCGKSTLLRLVAGLEVADGGTIALDGRPLAGVPTHLRGVGLMFQDFALFPHRSVAENVGFGLRMQRLPRAEVARRVAEVLALVGLSGYGQRTIFALSGGERQRVALARSLAPRPRLLMLDEPLGSLDRALREELTGELRDLIRQLGLTALYVTHDQAEAFAVADRIVLMRAGLVRQDGSPRALYATPATPFVARFLGLGTLLPARVVDLAPGLATVDSDLGRLLVAVAGPVALGPVTLLVRPEAARAPGGPNQIELTVVERAFGGAADRVTARHASGQLVELLVAAAPAPGQPVALALAPTALALLPAQSAPLPA